MVGYYSFAPFAFFPACGRQALPQGRGMNWLDGVFMASLPN